MMFATMVEPAASAPLLLGAQGSLQPAPAPASPSPASPPGPSPSPGGRAAGVDLRFRQRFSRILRLLRPYPALALAALSILESVTVAEVGKIAGSFYKIVVDDQPSLLAPTMLHAAALYAVCCAIYAADTLLAQGLAVRWRLRLTDHLQRLYCRRGAFYRLQKEVDNPDQRIAFDAAALCESLGAVVKVALAAPFKVAYYGWLTWGYIGWRGVLGVLGFFWAGALLQRLVMAPVARAVWRQEAREGDLRFAHLRLREYAAEAAQYGGDVAEGRQLAAALGAAVENQRRLVWLRTGLAATTRGIDYCGALLNYLLVAAAVFAGAAAGGDGGQLAQWVSNASFATLMLIYSFTELLDLSQQLSSMAGLTARVGQVLEALSPADDQQGEAQHAASQQGSAGRRPEQEEGEGHGGRRQGQEWRELWRWLLGGGRRAHRGYQRLLQGAEPGWEARLSIDNGQELQPSAFADLLVPPTTLPGTLADGSALEFSVHRLGPDLQRETLALFPGGPAPHPPVPPRLPQQRQQQQQEEEEAGEGAEDGARQGRQGGAVLAVLTFQFAAGGVSLAPDRSAHTLDKAAREMDRMLDNFLCWEAAVRAELARHGPYWCDAIDPRSGMALHGAKGTKWSEVAAAHALLGYERREAGICPVVVHPLHGTSAYPVSLFTDAPLPVLQAAISAACRLAGPSLSLSLSPAPIPAAAATAGTSAPQPAAPALLEMRGVTLRRLDGGLAVSDLSLALPPGCRLLISGPNGCGKSTLVKALCGMHPLEAGWVRACGAVVADAPAAAPGLAPLGSAGARGGAAAAAGIDGVVAAGVAAAALGPSGGPPSRPLRPSAAAAAAPLVAGRREELALAAVEQGTLAGVPGGVMVVPQRPLAAPGPALWQQVAYPDTRRPTAAELRRLLGAVGLGYLEGRQAAAVAAGGEAEGAGGGGWGAMLSPGELQRLSVARVLHRRPALAILDEVTASVSAEAASELYAALRSAGIACVSVGQDCAHLRAAHTHHLCVGVEGRGPGGWELRPLS